MTLEDSLRTLAAEDDAQVPPHVDAAVMAAWDASRPPVAGGSGVGLRWIGWVAVAAALAGAAALLPDWRGADGDTMLVRDEIVLVPELEARGPLTLMRVRMARREFSRLGVPISNPDGDGLVDVEVLVGEDGVARSIRRAVAVGRSGNP